MRRTFITVIAALFGATLFAQTEVDKFVPGSTLDGVNYFLPQTALRLIVETEETVTTPGALAKYAQHYLRLNDVPMQVSTRHTIKNILMEEYGQPDHNKAINVKVKSKTIAPLVTLSQDGLLLAINKEVKQQKLSDIPADIPAAPAVDPREYMTQEMLRAGSLAKQAELIAQEIYDIRESRNALIRGEADNTPKDGAQLQLMLQQLDEQANALESFFKGTTQTSTHYTVLYVLPTAESEQIIARFSSRIGLVDKDDLSGTPIYMKLQPQSKIPATVQNESTDKKKSKMVKGVYYNVPVRERVSIYNNEQTFLQKDVAMAQFGTTEILSDILFNKGATTRVSFFQQTGGIEKLEQ